MATGNQYNTLRDLLKAIADAIRSKVGDVGLISAQDFPVNIGAIVKATGNAGTGDVLSGKTFSNSDGNGLNGAMTNRGAWGTTINPSGSVTIPEGYHNGNGHVVANNISPSNMIIARNTNYVVTVRSGNYINIDSSVNVPSARISMIIAGGVGINDSGDKIGTTTVKAIATNGTEYTCNYSNGCYFVPTDTTYIKVTVHHSNYGGSQMSHGIIIPIIVFGY